MAKQEIRKEDGVVIVEKQRFLLEVLVGYDEKKFKKAFAGKVKCDLNVAWKKVKPALAKLAKKK